MSRRKGGEVLEECVCQYTMRVPTSVGVPGPLGLWAPYEVGTRWCSLMSWGWGCWWLYRLDGLSWGVLIDDCEHSNISWLNNTVVQEEKKMAVDRQVSFANGWGSRLTVDFINVCGVVWCSKLRLLSGVILIMLHHLHTLSKDGDVGVVDQCFWLVDITGYKSTRSFLKKENIFLMCKQNNSHKKLWTQLKI